MILGIIPARAGSKGILDKNIKPICGVPLIDYSIKAAREAKQLDDFIVSTDCEKIYERAKIFGVTYSPLRPEYLSTDTAKTIDAVVYELNLYEEMHDVRVDAVVLLQPTAPLRTSVDIDDAISLYKAQRQPSLISCYDAESVHPNIMYTLSEDGLIPYSMQGREIKRRQDMDKVYVRNGAIYIASREEVLNQNRMVSDTPSLYLMPRSRSVNIDSLDDFQYANYLMERDG